jgi:serine/threonine-protein kinase
VGIGTPEYMSPEQGRGKDIDLPSDVYSLGCVAYEMILGRPPFEGETPGDLLLAHVLERPVPPRKMWPTLPEPLDALLIEMLEKDPLARPPLTKVRTVLREMGADQSVRFLLPAPQGLASASTEVRSYPPRAPALAMRPSDPIEAAPRPARKRRRWVLVAGLAAALGVGAAVTYSEWPSPPPAPARAVEKVAPAPAPAPIPAPAPAAAPPVTPPAPPEPIVAPTPPPAEEARRPARRAATPRRRPAPADPAPAKPQLKKSEVKADQEEKGKNYLLNPFGD